MSQHTPGPWYVSPDMPGCIFKDIGDSAYLIASCDEWSEETEFNAHLIAAAPDLLACLQDVLDGTGDVTQGRISKWRAAVAKALGGAA